MSEEFNVALKEQLAAIELMQSVKNLEVNPDFQRVISRGFMIDFALNAVVKLGRSDDEGKELLVRQLTSVSVVSEYLANLTQEGEKALDIRRNLNVGD